MPEIHKESSRLRILVLSFMFYPHVGGAEAQAEKHARQLQARGHDVTVVAIRLDKHWPRTEWYDGLPIIRLGGIYRRNGLLRIGRLGHLPIELAAFYTLWRMRHQYDLIHAMQMSSIAAVAAVINAIMRKPIIISIQSAGPDEQQQEKMRREGVSLMADTLAEKLPDTTFLNVDADDWVGGDLSQVPQSSLSGQLALMFLKRSNAFYQVLSRRSYAYLVAHGFRPEQIIYIPNGIDIEKFQPAAELISQRERVILCVARLEYPKGVDVLLHAWAHMMRGPAEWRAQLTPRLRLVGEGIFSPQMERIVAELGIQDSVEFLGLRRDVVPLLQQAWGFVMPSRWEGMPNALLEAMACGLPCVATRVSGSEDIIVDGVNGWLVEPEQPAAMARALRTVIENVPLAQCIAQEARATILREYQIGSIIERSLNVYHRLLAADQSTPLLALEEERIV